MFEGLAQIEEEMEAVGDVGGARSPQTSAGGNVFAAIATDEADGRMLAKPGGNGFGFAIGKQFKREAGVEIDEEGAIALAFFPGPIIDADGGGIGGRRGKRSTANEA